MQKELHANRRQLKLNSQTECSALVFCKLSFIQVESGDLRVERQAELLSSPFFFAQFSIGNHHIGHNKRAWNQMVQPMFGAGKLWTIAYSRHHACYMQWVHTLQSQDVRWGNPMVFSIHDTVVLTSKQIYPTVPLKLTSASSCEIQFVDKSCFYWFNGAFSDMEFQTQQTLTCTLLLHFALSSSSCCSSWERSEPAWFIEWHAMHSSSPSESHGWHRKWFMIHTWLATHLSEGHMPPFLSHKKPVSMQPVKWIYQHSACVASHRWRVH